MRHCRAPIRAHRDGYHRERGSVTAEFALAVPAVVLVMLLVISLAMQGAARVALEDGTRAAARELARGESATTAQETLRQTAGDGVKVSITEDGPYTAVVATRPVRVLGLVELNAEQTAEAYARTEHLTAVTENP